MKAHIRKMPTMETYLKNLANVMKDFKCSVSPEIFDKFESRLASDEYFEKMKKAFGGNEDEQE